jgi:hypothetical protein
MNDREHALQRLRVGDIFHGRSPNGARLICLVTAVAASAIFARRITTQDDHQFDRRTGTELGGGHGRIDCVAPLPSEIHEVLVLHDRKGQVLAEQYRNGIEPDHRQYRLTSEERHAFQLLDEHVEANLI